MVSTRNRSLIIADYIRSLGVTVNIAQNKARGNKGFFSAKSSCYRIDISKHLSEEELYEVLIHEFAHYVHYLYDKKLKSLEFIFGDYDEDFHNQLIELTVLSIPKENATKLFEQKATLNNEISELVSEIKKEIPDFNKSKPCIKLEKLVKKTGLKYFLKYDNVKVLDFFIPKLYCISKIEQDFADQPEILKKYVILRSKQRFLNRISSRISKINKYYNSPTELFARAFTLYITNKNIVSSKAPRVLKAFDEALMSSKVKILNDFIDKL